MTDFRMYTYEWRLHQLSTIIGSYQAHYEIWFTFPWRHISVTSCSPLRHVWPYLDLIDRVWGFVFPACDEVTADSLHVAMVLHLEVLDLSRLHAEMGQSYRRPYRDRNALRQELDLLRRQLLRHFESPRELSIQFLVCLVDFKRVSDFVPDFFHCSFFWAPYLNLKIQT